MSTPDEIITSAVALGAEDYKESDKLVRLVTPDLGVVRAHMRGVKKEKAKLKFAAMPFAFCEYSLIRRGGFYTVKTASPIESLLSVTRSPDTFVVASVILETTAEATGETPAPALFVKLLEGLKKLMYSGAEPYSLGANYVSGLLEIGGFVPAAGEKKPCAENPEAHSPEKSLALLKRYVKLFENKYVCKIKSAVLL